jgi:hypothetical protein
METLIRQTEIKQANNNSITLKNQKVMKTKKYSISLKALAAVVFVIAFSASIKAQFVTPAPASNANAITPEEVRATSTVTYDLSANHNAGDTYRWVVRGGTIDDQGGTLTVTSDGDSSIVEFTANLESIDVIWNAVTPANPIGSTAGEIIVQKTAGGTCASQLQTLGITMWNPATANLDISALITEICSGEALGFTVPVDLTGAPNASANGFIVNYSYSATGGLTDLGGAPVNGVTGQVLDNDDQAQIPLPTGLVNGGASDETFTLTLTSMFDDFDEGGDVSASVSYTITVHPTPATGEINSTPAPLNRR